MRRWLLYVPSLHIRMDADSSSTGAIASYSTPTRTITLYNNCGPSDLLHELGHHVIHLLGGGDDEHCRYDAATWNIPVEWMVEHYKKEGILER
jgi:hypothetical protein